MRFWWKMYMFVKCECHDIHPKKDINELSKRHQISPNFFFWTPENSPKGWLAAILVKLLGGSWASKSYVECVVEQEMMWAGNAWIVVTSNGPKGSPENIVFIEGEAMDRELTLTAIKHLPMRQVTFSCVHGGGRKSLAQEPSAAKQLKNSWEWSILAASETFASHQAYINDKLQPNSRPRPSKWYLKTQEIQQLGIWDIPKESSIFHS